MHSNWLQRKVLRAAAEPRRYELEVMIMRDGKIYKNTVKCADREPCQWFSPLKGEVK